MRPTTLLIPTLLTLSSTAFAGDVRIVVEGTVESFLGPTSGVPALTPLQIGDAVSATYDVTVPGQTRPDGGTDYDVDEAAGKVATPYGSIGGATGGVGECFAEDGSGIDLFVVDAMAGSGIRVVTAIVDQTGVMLDTEDLAALVGTTIDAPSIGGTQAFFVRDGSTTVRMTLGTITIENADSVGANYCSANANSSGASATIAALGSAAVSANDLSLRAEGVPSNVFGFFLASRDQGFVMNPAGSAGNLCLGGAIGRFVGGGQIQSSGAAGSFELDIDLTLLPQPTGPVAGGAGESWSFQAWFRDSAGGAATSNLTDGVEVTLL